MNQAVLKGCTQCAGLWIDNATVEMLSRRHDPDVESAAWQLTRVIALPMSHEQRIAELACPVCAVRMRRVQIPETIYSADLCAAHGTWFDRHELDMFIRTFSDARAGNLTGDDLTAAGGPMRADGNGFFGGLLALLKAATGL